MARAPLAGFAARLRDAVVGSGMTQREVAARARVSGSLLSAYCCGHYSPSLHALARLCLVLRVSPEWLMFGRAPGYPAFSGDNMKAAGRPGVSVR